MANGVDDVDHSGSCHSNKTHSDGHQTERKGRVRTKKLGSLVVVFLRKQEREE